MKPGLLLGLALLLAAPLRAESYAEVRARCPRREVVTVAQEIELTQAWSRHPGCSCIFVGTTASMEPFISWWDSVLVSQADPKALTVGNVYIYRAQWSEAPVIHQLVRISGEWCLFRGPNNRRFDPWVRRDAVQFVVRRILGTRADNYALGMNP